MQTWLQKAVNLSSKDKKYLIEGIGAIQTIVDTEVATGTKSSEAVIETIKEFLRIKELKCSLKKP